MAGVLLGEAVRRAPERHRANMLQVLDWVAAGRLKPHIHGTYPSDQIGEALSVLERREATGKVVVTMAS